MRAPRKLWWAAPAVLVALSACGQVPESTEKARGVLGGINIVLAMSALFIVGAVGIIVAAMALDRMVRSRRALEDEPAPVDEEPEEEVVAGITMGRASVPRWLYAAYVLIPLFAMAYVFSNVAVAPAETEATPEPTPSGPCTECTIVAIPTIKFETDTLTVAAEQDITVSFDNRDTAVPHNLTVWPTEADATANEGKIAGTSDITGPSEATMEFKAPKAGEQLYFNCTIHPSMKGDVVAEEASA